MQKVDEYNLFIDIVSIKDPKSFIKSMKDRYKNSIIQIFDINAIADQEHLMLITIQSINAMKRNTMLADKVEMDMLLRIACTNQIYKALEFAGAKDDSDAVLLILSKDEVDIDSKELKQSKDRIEFLIKYHGISNEELDACLEDNKIAYILAERANLLY